MPAQRPNILCFVTDQHRADHLGCYGNRQVRTPNIDRLASEGVVFTESYVANPVCMPNRATMFTGRYPKAHGLRENGMALSPSEQVMPELLRSAGYQTASVGKIHLAPFDMTTEFASHEYELYESHQWWARSGKLPLPYYGLEQVSLVDGHGPYAFGDYKRWLDENHPGAYDRLQARNALGKTSGARQCWHASIEEELHYNTFVADRSIDFLRKRDRERPFFLWCSFPDPHHPFSPPKPYCDMYDPAQTDFRPARREGEFADLPPYFEQVYLGEIGTGGTRGDQRTITDDHYREIIALTYGMVSMVDTNVGRVMDALREQGLVENTIVVFLSDHGDLMGDHWILNKGPFLYRGLVRVPTIWRVPGGANRSSADMISTVDLCPTLLDFAGVTAPEGVQGVSYRDAIEGRSERKRDRVYIEYDEHYLHDRLRQIRTRDFALTYYAQSSYGLLFDLRKDPDELHNVWDHPDYHGTRQDLLAELLRLTSRADDWLPEKRVHA